MSFSLKKIFLKKFGQTSFFLWIYRNWLGSDRKKVVAETVHELKRLENLDSNSLKELNELKLKEILIHAYNTVPYYKQIFDASNFFPKECDNFKTLPLLTKQIIKTEKDDLLSSIFKKEDLDKNLTSGSTGEPTEFYRDRLSSEIDNGHHYYCYDLMGYDSSQDRIVGCFGRNLSKELLNRNIFWSKNKGSNIFGEYTLSAHYLNDETVKYYIEFLFNFKPAIIRGYPSAVYKLALYLLKERIDINFNVKGINLTSEVCTEEQRKKIEKAFRTQVYLEYGNKEICMFSYTKDKSYIYQSSPIYCHLEVINDDGSETKVGDIGKVIATGFVNKGMPFIRYDTGDLAILESRNGGIVRLKEVVGRDHDYIIDKNGDKFYQIRLNSSFYIQNIDAFKEVNIWQFRQSTIGKCDVLIVATDNITDTSKQVIKDSFSSFKEIEFNLKYVKEIPKPKSGKHLFFVREIKD